jgi:hypothetical protein
MGSIHAVHFFPTTTKEPMLGCNLYEILALNDKGMMKGLEGPSRGTSTTDMFQEKFLDFRLLESWGLK